jgi:regulator of protease activity HflC (stomatin/prohibitin superfamily)
MTNDQQYPEPKPEAEAGAGGYAVPEREARRVSGYLTLVLLLLVLALIVVLIAVGGSQDTEGGKTAILVPTLVLGPTAIFFGLKALAVVHPNQARVLQLFGRYTGTIREPGLWALNPFISKRTVSLRARNFESSKLKVNDLDGNPVEIASVVVWHVEDPAAAVFQVDDFEEFVTTQTETAVRHLATSYPYDREGEEPSLRSGLDLGDELSAEIQERVTRAGVRILDARITHLAYAPEIAQAMLQRQQAGAVVAARRQIVEGAVGMVEMALERLNEREVVDLDEERKAAMVSNLLVVLCGDRSTQPVVNTGTLYQ